MPCLLVAGASGVNGLAVTKHFSSQPDWEVMTLSRSEEPIVDGVSHLRADLTRPATLEAHAHPLSKVTHLFYAALAPDPDPAKEAETNAAMFEAVLEPLAANNSFERVVFLQGGKVYGAHLGVYKTPAREEDSRHFPPNLYFRQEDHAREVADKFGIGWTALRPDIVIGHSLGSAMNLGHLIGLYGTLCRETGTAMQFPGTAAAYDVLVNVTDADIVARACDWAIANRMDGAFNITNGDQFRWRHVWPKLCAWFELNEGEPQPISLETRLPAMQHRWARLAERDRLSEMDMGRIAKGAFGDFIFHVENDAVFDVTRARAAGFDQMTRRSDDSLIAHLDAMREARLIP